MLSIKPTAKIVGAEIINDDSAQRTYSVQFDDDETVQVVVNCEMGGMSCIASDRGVLATRYVAGKMAVDKVIDWFKSRCRVTISEPHAARTVLTRNFEEIEQCLRVIRQIAAFRHDRRTDKFCDGVELELEKFNAVRVEQ
jgi:hypothetical protein